MKFSLKTFGGEGKNSYLSGMERNETIPSYKRRMNDWDYSQPRIYMLTLTTEGRQPVLGTLVGDVSLPTTDPNGPCLLPSALGEAVLQEVDGIPRYYPQISIIARQLMPDHLHILLYVMHPLPVHLGQVVSGFKAGCNRKWRETQRQGETTQRQGETTQRQSRWAPDQAAKQGEKQGTDQGACRVPDGSAGRKGLLWEQGYHDRVLSGQGQLQRLVDYIRENPRRSLVKRQHAGWFHATTITAAGTSLHAVGNLQLLQALQRRAVRVSSRITEEERSRQQQELLGAAREGCVLISPFISSGERFVEEAALQEGLSVVKLLPNGFAPFYKPQGSYFEACAEGRLLLLSPYEYTTQKVVLTRGVCNYLNVLAARLAE